MENNIEQGTTAPETNMSLDMSFYARIDYLLGQLNHYSSLILGSFPHYSEIADWRCSLDNLYKELYPLMTTEEKKTQNQLRISVDKIDLLNFQMGKCKSEDINKVIPQFQEWELSLRMICYNKGILLRNKRGV